MPQPPSTPRPVISWVAAVALGLAGLVHAHGGTVRASNRPLGGAELLVRLPACTE